MAEDVLEKLSTVIGRKVSPVASGRKPTYVAGENVRGLRQPGNIDITNRPVVPNPSAGPGQSSTVLSMGIESDGKHVLIPMVSDGADGKPPHIMGKEEAIGYYRKTGKHLGIFDSDADADNYGKNILHPQQATLQNNNGRAQSAAPDLSTIIGRQVQPEKVSPLAMSRYQLYSKARTNGFDAPGAIKTAMSTAGIMGGPGTVTTPEEMKGQAAKPQTAAEAQTAWESAKTSMGEAVQRLADKTPFGANIREAGRIIARLNEVRKNPLGMSDKEWAEHQADREKFFTDVLEPAMDRAAWQARVPGAEVLGTGPVKGVVEHTAEFAESMLSPEQMALLAGTMGESALVQGGRAILGEGAAPVARGLSKLMQAQFSAQMIQGTGEAAKASFKAAVSGDWKEATGYAVDGLISGLMAKGIISHELATSEVRRDLEKTAREKYGAPEGNAVTAAINSRFDQLDPYRQGLVIDETVRNSKQYQDIIKDVDGKNAKATARTKKQQEGRLNDYYSHAMSQAWDENVAKRTMRGLQRGREAGVRMESEGRQAAYKEMVDGWLKELSDRQAQDRADSLKEYFGQRRDEREQRRKTAAAGRSEVGRVVSGIADSRDEVSKQREEFGAIEPSPTAPRRTIEAIVTPEGQVAYPAMFWGEENHFAVAGDVTGHSVYRQTPRGVEWLDNTGNFSESPASLYTAGTPDEADTMARLAALTTESMSRAEEDGGEESVRDADELSAIFRDYSEGTIDAREARKRAGIADATKLPDEYTAARDGRLNGPFHDSSAKGYYDGLREEAKALGMSDEDTDALLNQSGMLARQQTENNLHHVGRPGDYIVSKRGVRWTLDSKGVLHSDEGGAVPLMRRGMYSNDAVQLAQSGRVGYGTQTRDQRRASDARRRQTEEDIRKNQDQVDQEMRMAVQREGIVPAAVNEPRPDNVDKAVRQARFMSRPPKPPESAVGGIVRMVLTAPTDAKSVINAIAARNGVSPQEVMRLQLANDPARNNAPEAKVARLEIGDSITDDFRKDRPWKVEQGKDGKLYLRSGNASPLLLDRLNPSDRVKTLVNKGKVTQAKLNFTEAEVNQAAFERPHYVNDQERLAEGVRERMEGKQEDPDPWNEKEAERQAQQSERRKEAATAVATRQLEKALDPEPGTPLAEAEAAVDDAHQAIKVAEAAADQEAKAKARAVPEDVFPEKAPVTLGYRSPQQGSVIQNGREVPVHYEVVPLGSLVASHQWNGALMEINPDFPESLQPRTISDSESHENDLRAEADRRETDNGKWVGYDFREYADKTQNGSMGPAIVDPRGFVAGGNTRISIMRRHLDNLNTIGDPELREAKIDGFKAAMRKLAADVGVPGFPDDGGFNVVVRVLDKPIESTREATDLGNLFNSSISVKIRESARGISYARNMTPELLEDIGRRTEAYDGLNAAMMSDPEFFRKIVTDKFGVPKEEFADWFDDIPGRGLILNDSGKSKFSKVMLGTVIKDSALLNRIEGKAAYRAVERALPWLIKIQALPERDITAKITEALNASAEVMNTDPGLSNSNDRWLATYHPDQQGFLGMEVLPSEPDRMTEVLWRALTASDAATPRTFNDRIKSFIGEESSLAGLIFEEQKETPAEAFNRAFSKELRETAFARKDKVETITQDEYDAALRNRELSDAERLDAENPESTEGGRGQSPEQAAGGVEPPPANPFAGFSQNRGEQPGELMWSSEGDITKSPVAVKRLADKNTVVAYARVGEGLVGSITLKRDEWPKDEAARKELIRKKMAEAESADFDADYVAEHLAKLTDDIARTADIAFRTGEEKKGMTEPPKPRSPDIERLAKASGLTYEQIEKTLAKAKEMKEKYLPAAKENETVAQFLSEGAKSLPNLTTPEQRAKWIEANMPVRMVFENATVITDALHPDQLPGSWSGGKTGWGAFKEIQPLEADDPWSPNQPALIHTGGPRKEAYDRRMRMKEMMGKGNTLIVKRARRSTLREFTAKLTDKETELIRVKTGQNPREFWRAASGKPITEPTDQQAELDLAPDNEPEIEQGPPKESKGLTKPPAPPTRASAAERGMGTEKAEKGYVTPEKLQEFLEAHPATKDSAPTLMRTAKLMAEYVFDADPPEGVDRKDALGWVLKERLAGIEAGELKNKRGQYSDPLIEKGVGDGIMKLHKAADPSTFIHEFSHVIFPMLSDEDLKAIDTIQGPRGKGAWDGTRASLTKDVYAELSEKLANGVESFLRDENPTGFTHEVKAVLAKVKEIMRKVYLAFAKDPLSDFEPTEEAREVFSKMFGIADFDVKDDWRAEMKKARAEDKRMKMPEETLHPIQKVASDAGAIGIRDTITGRVEDSAGERLDPRKPTTVLIFPSEEKAAAFWDHIVSGRGKVTAAELIQTEDGGWAVRMNTKVKVPRDVLYQDAPQKHPGLELEETKKRLAETPASAPMVRKLLQLKIQNLENEIRSRYGAETTPVVEKPAEIAAAARKEIKNANPNNVRKEADGESRVHEPERPRGFSAPPRPPEPKNAGANRAGGVRQAGSGVAGARVPASLAQVPAVGIQPLAIERGAAVGTTAGETFNQDAWKRSLTTAGLPDNLPPPTWALNRKTAEKLIFPGQKEVVQTALSALEQGDGFVGATATGTGKTYTGMAIIKEWRDKHPDARILYITKNQKLLRNARGVSENTFGFEMEKKLPDRDAPTGVYGMSYMGMIADPKAENTHWDLVIADESGEARNWFKEDNQQGKRLMAVTANADKVAYFSATPFHSPMEYGYMTKLNLWPRNGFDKWIEQNFAHEKIDGKVIARLDPAKQAKLRQQLIERGQLVSQAISYDGFTAHFGVVPVTDSMKRGLDRIHEGFSRAKAQLIAMKRKGLAEKIAAFEATYTKAYLERERLPQAIEIAQRARRNGWQVMLFSETSSEDLFRRTREAGEEVSTYQELDDAMGGQLSRIIPPFPNIYEKLKEAFGEQIGDYSGRGNSMGEREKALTDYLTGERPMIYSTYAAGGIGVSLHDADYPELGITGGERPRVSVFLGPPYSGVLLEQAMGRSWRFGVKSDTHSVFLATDSEPDVRLMQMKVGPRMKALRASVLGEKDSLANVMATYTDEEKTRERQEALAYQEGNEPELNAQNFQVRSRSRNVGINDWSLINFPPADTAKNKGMKYGEHVAGGDWSNLYQSKMGMLFPDTPEQSSGKETVDSIGNGLTSGAGVPPGTSVQNLDPSDRDVVVGAAASVATDAVDVSQDRDAKAAARQAMQFQMQLPGDKNKWILTFPNKRGKIGVWKYTGDPEELKRTPVGDEPVRQKDIRTWYGGFSFTQEIGIQSISRRAGAGEAGDNIVRMNRSYQADADVNFADFAMTAVDIAKKYKLDTNDPQTMNDLWDAVEGKRVVANPDINSAVEEIADLHERIHSAEGSAGVKLKTPSGEVLSWRQISKDRNYMPHRIDWDAKVQDPLTGETHILRDIMKETFAEAKRRRIIEAISRDRGYTYDQVVDYLHAYSPNTPVLSHIHRARSLDFPFIKKDWRTLMGYYRQAADAIAIEKNFGSDRGKLEKEISRIPSENGRKTIKSMFDGLLEPQEWQDWTAKVYNAAIAFEAGSKMTISVTKVPFHLVHIPMGLKGRVMPMVKAIARDIFHHKDVMDNATYVGTVARQLNAADVISGPDTQGITHQIFGKTGFNAAYKQVRAIAGESARIWMEQYAMRELKKGNPEEARRILRDVMLIGDKAIDEAIANGRFSPEDLAKGQTGFTNLVAWSNNPLQMPGWARIHIEKNEATTTVGLKRAVRLTYALQSFSLKSTSLLREQLYDEVVHHKNFKPLAYALVAYPIIGQMLGATGAAAKGFVHHGIEGLEGKKHEQDSWDKFLANLEDTFEHPEAVKFLKFYIDGWTLGVGWDRVRRWTSPFLNAAIGKNKEAQSGLTYLLKDEGEQLAGPAFSDLIELMSYGVDVGKIELGEKHPEQKGAKVEAATKKEVKQIVPIVGQVPGFTNPPKVKTVRPHY